jgi:hypothetical protein
MGCILIQLIKPEDFTKEDGTIDVEKAYTCFSSRTYQFTYPEDTPQEWIDKFEKESGDYYNYKKELKRMKGMW